MNMTNSIASTPSWAISLADRDASIRTKLRSVDGQSSVDERPNDVGDVLVQDLKMESRSTPQNLAYANFQFIGDNERLKAVVQESKTEHDSVKIGERVEVSEVKREGDSFILRSTSYNSKTGLITEFDESRALVNTDGDRQATKPDIEGPYYRADAPWRTELHSQSEPGDRLKLGGSVRGTDGKLIPGAVVDVWMADAKGEYDNESEEFKGRGRSTTGAIGNFSFDSVRPGNYAIPGQIRPAHIHIKVTAPGYAGLTTQLYFTDDQYNEQDPWFEMGRAMTPEQITDTSQAVNFDFVISKLADAE